MDKKHTKFSWSKRLDSFKHAFNGFKILFREEYNSRLHLIIAIVAVVLGVLFHISLWEWIVIVLLIGLVFSLEIINSAIENICDYISPQYHKQIKKIKDLSAAAVLLMAVVSVVIGLLIFVPRFIELVYN